MKKKIIAIGIIGMFILTSFSIFVVAENEPTNDKITLDYIFDTPVIENVEIAGMVYDQIVINDAPNCGNPGEPSLPAKGAYILIPQGEKVSSITVNHGEMINLGSGYFVEPVGESVPLSEIDSAPLPVPDETIYNSNDLFPGRFFTEIGTYDCKGYEILVLKLHPVQYIPMSGELFYYPDLSVSVETVEDGDVSSLFRGLEKDELEIISKVENPAMVGSYALNTQQQTVLGQPLTLDNYDLLIITSEALKDGFIPLKQAHDADGLNTLIYTVEDIYNNYSGVDNAEKLRNFIKYAYINLGIEYVLLGGDNQIIPCRNLYARDWWDYEYIPSDCYYACLDGTYNFNNNDRWGEPNDGENGSDVDLLAEVFVGRACVDNSQDVQNFVGKAKHYMSLSDDDEYLKKITLAGELLGFGTVANYASNSLNELIGKCSKHDYITQGFPSYNFIIDKLYDNIFYEWPKGEIIRRINDGLHIIVHYGHAGDDYNMRMEISDVEALTNNDYFFVYSVGCSSGDFNERDCIAEYFTVKTSNGAFAGIWNSRSGWGARDSTDSPSQRYNREFWDAVFGENITVISKANQDSKEDNIWRIDQPYMRYIFYELNLFGDPAIQYKYLDSSLAVSMPVSQSSSQLSSQQSQSSQQTTPTSTTSSTPTSR